jgi:hypothetical protein
MKSFDLIDFSSSQSCLIGCFWGECRYSGYVQTGNSGVQAVDWVSATSVVCKSSAGTGGSLVLALTLGHISGSCTNVISYNVGVLSSITKLYLDTSGRQGVTISGLDLGTILWSSLSRIGQSSALSTNWASATSIFCNFVGGIGRSLLLSLTVGSCVGSITESITYLSSSASSVSPPNLATIGLGGITAYGAYFGTSSHCVSGRLGSSSVRASSWTSDTSILCLSAAGAGNAVQVSVSAGAAFSTLLSAVSYNLPLITSPASKSQARSITGTWCANDGDVCYCQGIVSNVLNDGSFTGTYLDSSVSVTCSAFMCYCFNLPFTGGQIVTVIGQDFGTSDYSPTATVMTSSAEFTQWLSQSSLLCALPKCTDCSSSSSTSNSIKVVVAAQTSSVSDISVDFSLVNGTRRSSKTQVSSPSSELQISYVFSVPESQKCPQFWQSEGLFVVSQGSGMLCRLNYGPNDNIQWIIDPCKMSDQCSQVREESVNTCSIIQTRLSITQFSSGPGDILSIFSCVSSTCSSRWAKFSQSGEIAPVSFVGDPSLLLAWTSNGFTDVSAGWIANWKTEFGRIFKFFADATSQEEARSVCQRLEEGSAGWDLASINSVHEQSVVERLTSSVPVWIGLTDKNEEGVYMWTDGSLFIPQQFVQWGPGEPDNFGEKNLTNADCTLLVHESIRWVWKTEDCQGKRAFVCSRR